MRRCRRCGALLASDHDDAYCSPCMGRNRGYDPTADPAFVGRLLLLLYSRRGQVVEPLKELGIAYEYRSQVKDGIRTLRRRGFQITACERSPGYVFVGFEALEEKLLRA